MPKYEVKNVKSFMGREGYGYECTLYKDGVRIGTVTDTADGGCADYYLNKGEKELLDTYCKTLPKVDSGLDCGDEDSTIDVDADIFVARLVDEYEKSKEMRGWCRKGTIFRINGMEEGRYRSLKSKFSQQVKEYLEKKYAGQGLVIMNETIK